MDHVRRAPVECIPRILHMIWLGCEPPGYFWANKREWERLMPNWQVLCWHDTAGVDDRVRAHGPPERNGSVECGAICHQRPGDRPNCRPPGARTRASSGQSKT